MARCTFGTLVVFLASAFTLASSSASAQTAPAPVRLSIQIVNVKPEALNDWIALQEKETIPALKKIKARRREAWTTAIFGEAFQYFFSQPLDKFANYDNPQGPMIRALGADGGADLQRQAPEDDRQPADVGDHRPAREHRPAGILRAEVHDPELQLRGSGPRGRLRGVLEKRPDTDHSQGQANRIFVASRTLHGGDANEFVTARYLEKMADLDGPNLQQQAIGNEAANKLGAKTAGMIQRTERRVYRYVPNLSFK